MHCWFYSNDTLLQLGVTGGGVEEAFQKVPPVIGPAAVRRKDEIANAGVAGEWGLGW